MLKGACVMFCAGLIWTIALPASAEPPPTPSRDSDLARIIQRNHRAETGIASNVGLVRKNGDKTISGIGINPDTQFRIGSQTKTFTGSAALLMIDRGYFSLNDTVASLQKKYNVDFGLSQLPAGTESITVEQLLNMSSRIPNYMGRTRSGVSSTLWNEWISARYGSVTPPVTHAELAALGLSGYPNNPTPPFQGSYSNTNAIILSLIGEAAYAAHTGRAKPYAAILNEMVLAPAGLKNTYLATTSSSTGIAPGSESGRQITDMDPTIPWTSGAMVSTLEDQLKWLKILKTNTLPDGSPFLSERLFAARTNLANSTLISMGGMKLQYGYNIFTLDFTEDNVPLTMIGHGGSIAGYSSFSAWHQQLDLGLVVNAPTLGAIDRRGVYTGIPSEALLMDLCRGLERLHRADGSLIGVEKVSAGAKGGYVTFAPIITDARQSTSFVVEPSARTTSYLDLAFLALGDDPVRTTSDPTLTYYATAAGAAAVTLTSGVNGRVAKNARAEAHGPKTAVIRVGSCANLELEGEAAAYGEAASAIQISAGGALHTRAGSLASVQGGAGSAIKVAAGAGAVHLAGALTAVGASSALHLDGSAATVESSGTLTAVTAAYSMTPDFTTVSPQTHAAYGASLENGAILDLHGGILAQATHPWDGTPYTLGARIIDPALMPGALAVGISLENAAAKVHGMVASSGYGVWMKNGVNSVHIADGAVEGGLLAIKGENGNDRVVLAEGGLVHGNIDLGEGNNSLTAEGGALALDLANTPCIRGADTLLLDQQTKIRGTSGVLGDNSYLLATDVTSYTGGILLQDPSRPVSFTLSENNGDIMLASHRDWSHYATHTANSSLGATIDQMAFAAVNGTLSPGAYGMIEALEASSDPGRNALQLQPFSPNGLALSQIRQTSGLHQTITSRQMPSQDKNWFAFGAFQGHFGQQDASGQAFGDYDLEGSEATAGFGRNLNSRVQTGIFLQYSTEEMSSDTIGQAQDTILRVGPFARWSSSGTQWSLALAPAFHEVKSTRSTPFLQEANLAAFSMRDVLLSSSLSHAFALNSITLTPYLEAAYQHAHSNGYTEKGGISALAVDSWHGDYFAATAGLEASRSFTVYGVTVTPLAGLGWWRQWLEQPAVDAAFRSDPAFRFSSTGADLDQDLIRLHASLDLATSGGWRFNIAYDQYNGSSLRDSRVLGLTIGGVF